MTSKAHPLRCMRGLQVYERRLEENVGGFHFWPIPFIPENVQQPCCLDELSPGYLVSSPVAFDQCKRQVLRLEGGNMNVLPCTPAHELLQETVPPQDFLIDRVTVPGYYKIAKLRGWLSHVFDEDEIEAGFVLARREPYVEHHLGWVAFRQIERRCRIGSVARRRQRLLTDASREVRGIDWLGEVVVEVQAKLTFR